MSSNRKGEYYDRRYRPPFPWVEAGSRDGGTSVAGFQKLVWF